jgi:hypothetical protein
MRNTTTTLHGVLSAIFGLAVFATVGMGSAVGNALAPFHGIFGAVGLITSGVSLGATMSDAVPTFDSIF